MRGTNESTTNLAHMLKHTRARHCAHNAHSPTSTYLQAGLARRFLCCDGIATALYVSQNASVFALPVRNE